MNSKVDLLSRGPHSPASPRFGDAASLWPSFVPPWSPVGLLRRLLVLNGSPGGIAGGFALGLMLSLVPIPVLGMVVALALAPVLRLNPPATYLGTAVVNPLTGPLFYFAELWLGHWALGRPLPSWATLRELDAAGWWALLQQSVLPFAVGAAMLCTLAAAASLPLLWWWLARHRRVIPTDPQEESRDGQTRCPPGPEESR